MNTTVTLSYISNLAAESQFGRTVSAAVSGRRQSSTRHSLLLPLCSPWHLQWSVRAQQLLQRVAQSLPPSNCRATSRWPRQRTHRMTKFQLLHKSSASFLRIASAQAWRAVWPMSLAMLSSCLHCTLAPMPHTVPNGMPHISRSSGSSPASSCGQSLS